METIRGGRVGFWGNRAMLVGAPCGVSLRRSRFFFFHFKGSYADRGSGTVCVTRTPLSLFHTVLQIMLTSSQYTAPFCKINRCKDMASVRERLKKKEKARGAAKALMQSDGVPPFARRAFV